MAIGLESGPLPHSREKLLQGKTAGGAAVGFRRTGMRDYTTRVSDF